MRSKPFVKVMMMFFVYCSFVPDAEGQADKRFVEMAKLAEQGKPEEALEAGRKYLKDLRDTLPENDRDVIGFAAIAVGMVASKAGEHEEAVRLLGEGLPIVNRVREGQLWAEEAAMTGTMASSLRALKRSDQAVEVLDDLVKRIRKQLANPPKSGGLNIDRSGAPGVPLDAMWVNEDSLADILEQSGTLKLELKLLKFAATIPASI